MKKQKIREMLTMILAKLNKLEADNGHMDVEQAKKIAADARAVGAKAREVEEQLQRKTREVTRLEQRLAETERDRDSWKRECERYAAGSSDPRSRD